LEALFLVMLKGYFFFYEEKAFYGEPHQAVFTA